MRISRGVTPGRKAVLLHPKPEQYADRLAAVLKQAGIEQPPVELGRNAGEKISLDGVDENAGATGMVVAFGKFRLTDTGPDLYQMRRVAILSAGYDHVFEYQAARSQFALEDIWELNYQMSGGKDGNTPEPFIHCQS